VAVSLISLPTLTASLIPERAALVVCIGSLMLVL
jgi:hypothetical protein